MEAPVPTDREKERPAWRFWIFATLLGLPLSYVLSLPIVNWGVDFALRQEWFRFNGINHKAALAYLWPATVIYDSSPPVIAHWMTWWFGLLAPPLF